MGAVQRNLDLARTYALLARFGSRAFYRGRLARAIVQAVQHPPVAPTANHTWRPGLLTADDIVRYEAIERAPTHVSYRGLDILGMRPPSSGGSTVGEALNILAGFPDLGADRTRACTYLEAARLAFADRGEYVGGPGVLRRPLAACFPTAFAAERGLLIDPLHADNAASTAGDPADDQASRAERDARPGRPGAPPPI